MNTVFVRQGCGHINKANICDTKEDLEVVYVDNNNAPLARYCLSPIIWDKRDSISYKALGNKVVFEGVNPCLKYECLSIPID